MIQICKKMGASSIAIASSYQKIKLCKKLGSFDGINYKQTPLFSERVKLITDNEGVDVIMDPVLGSFFEENLNCLGFDSRWVIYGSMGGIKVIDANFMKLLNKRAFILTSTLRNRSDEYKTELIQEMARDLMPGFISEELKPIID